MRRLAATAFLIVACLAPALGVQELTLPMREGSTRFAVIGDSGTGGDSQKRVADRLAAAHTRYPFELTLMLGDNLYGGESPGDYRRKFEVPYKPLLDAGVKFYAALGNHDDPSQRYYQLFNMNGERYYSFKGPQANVRFFALDSNYMAREQLDWLDKELAASGSAWKIVFFHHPIYSSGEKHGSDQALRDQVEPLFTRHGVDVVFTGHEHFYERLKPQLGIHYFVSGSAAKLRRGNIAERSPMTAKGYDDGYTFMLIEIAGDELFFQTISADGATVDSGIIKRREARITSR